MTKGPEDFFSEHEMEVIKSESMRWGVEVDYHQVIEEMQSVGFYLEDWESHPSEFLNLPLETQLAITFRTMRQPHKKVEQYLIKNHKKTIQSGLSLIKGYDEYWRFEPCILKLREMDHDSLTYLLEYLESFFETDYFHTLNQHKTVVLDKREYWNQDETSSQNTILGKEIFNEASSLFESGFPNLLAMKRILDGECPKNDDLQNLRASSVRRELTDRDDANSAYFDLIVEGYDNQLRNAMAHGSFLNDPSNKEIRIPTRNLTYSYEQFNNAVAAAIANSVFLTGLFYALVQESCSPETEHS
ncbi:hypothetical protein [Haloferax prahovense]|uniref:hypothetical protein n=1 Tax=Haloferax prahovense TaxID=381852 RepID=UPI001268D7E1|nr:hypothetical protein [Haloferax prahovense]